MAALTPQGKIRVGIYRALLREWNDGTLCGENMVRPERFELPTFWFVARRSIQLS